MTFSILSVNQLTFYGIKSQWSWSMLLQIELKSAGRKVSASKYITGIRKQNFNIIHIGRGKKKKKSIIKKSRMILVKTTKKNETRVNSTSLFPTRIPRTIKYHENESISILSKYRSSVSGSFLW